MRAIITSDWHGDWSTAGYERASDIEAAVDELVGVAIKSRADFFLFLGDLTNPDSTRAHRAVELAVRTAVRLSEAGIESRWLAGNHDVLEDGHGTTTLGALRELGAAAPRCKVFERPQIEEVGGGISFLALPFVPRSHAYDPEVFVRAHPQEDDRVIVLGHLNIEGIEPGSETSDMPRGRDVMFPLAACRAVYGDRATLFNGHYHKQQQYKGINIPGSLERLTFAEAANAPGYLYSESDGVVAAAAAAAGIGLVYP